MPQRQFKTYTCKGTNNIEQNVEEMEEILAKNDRKSSEKEGNVMNPKKFH